MYISMEGKVAIVTGASKGIGKAIASQLAAAGANVMLTSRKIDQLEAAAAEIEASGAAGHAAVFAGNAGSIEVADACVAATVERFGRVDVLVNNAATNPHFGPTLEIEPSKFDKTFEVNLRGPLYWARAANRAFGTTPGVIINIASVGGLRSEFGLGVYNLTKAALVHFTTQLASEIGPTRVVGIAPGLVQTDFAQVLVDNFGETLATALPTKRLGLPADIANLAVFLASDAASWITGQTIVIDGGGMARTGG